MMQYYWLIFGLLFMTCHEQNKNKIPPAELVKSREIKKVSEAEILRGGSALGDEIMKSVTLLFEIKTEQDSIECPPAKWPKLDSLTKVYGTNIRKVGAKTPAKTPLESQLLEAYQYNIENNLYLTPSVQKLDSKTVLYTHPIGKYSKHYKYCPDSASHKGSEMWSIKIPIKEIINKL